MKKRCFAIILTLIVCFSIVPIGASAMVETPDADEVMPRFVAINTIYALLKIDESNGIATCVGEVRAREMVQLKVVDNLVWSLTIMQKFLKTLLKKLPANVKKDN